MKTTLPKMMKFFLKNLSLPILLISQSTIINAQSSASLDINNVGAIFSGEGNLFWDFTTTKFEVPKGSGKGTIFTGNIWVGGIDAGSQLHIAAQTYKQNGTDFFQGPMMSSINYSSAQDAIWNKVWKINKSTVDSFILGKFGTPPPSIANWPANGNTSLGQASVLAPYMDVNNNGTYDPINGDYPIIRGDQAVYFIFNDDRNLHGESGGTKLGIEIHGMAYAFNCMSDSAFKNTIFIHYDILNRSINNYSKTRIGSFTDFDIGSPFDDYIGCDTLLNAYFSYNGTVSDGSGSGNTYGTRPPAQGVVSLSLPMYGFVAPSVGNPIASEYNNCLDAKWKNGTSVTYGGDGTGGTIPTKYMFPTDPSATTGWNETIASIGPGDRRSLASLDNFTFSAGATKSFDIAYVFGRDYSSTGTNLTSVNVLKQRIQTIQTAFGNNTTPCGGQFVGITEKTGIENKTISLYPNPANDIVIINFQSVSSKTLYEVYDMTGKIILSGKINSSGKTPIETAALSKGIYLIKVLEENNLYNSKFIKQ